MNSTTTNRRLRNQVAQLHGQLRATRRTRRHPSQTPSTTRATWSRCQTTEPTREDHRDPQGGHDFLRAGVRPAPPVICEFIAEHRARFGVAPICRVLSRARRARSPREPTTPGSSRAPSKRALWDTAITEVLAGYYEPDEHGRREPESLYGSLKMWAHLQPGGHRGRPVHRGTADAAQRLARRDAGEEGPHHGPRPGRGPGAGPGRAAVPGPAPNRLLVADFTYVRMVSGLSSTPRSSSTPPPTSLSVGSAQRRSRPRSWNQRSGRPPPVGPAKATR